jgi:hypothetical protein
MMTSSQGRRLGARSDSSCKHLGVLNEPTKKGRPRVPADPDPTRHHATPQIRIEGQEEWLASEEGRRFLAMSESERDAYRSELLEAPALQPFRRTYKGNMKTLSRAQMLRDGKEYENAWNLIE